MKLLETEWMSFRNAAIPANAPSVQLTDMRRAFFAGAMAYYTLVMTKMASGEEPTEEDANLLRALDREMEEFAERVKKGWA